MSSAFYSASFRDTQLRISRAHTDSSRQINYCFLTRVAVGGSARPWILKGRCDGFRYLSFISSSLKASVGVRQPRHFLGVPFKRSQIDFISRFESAARCASLGKYLRARLFRFSTEPFCHGACGSQNQASDPRLQLAPVLKLNPTIKGDRFAGRLG